VLADNCLPKSITLNIKNMDTEASMDLLNDLIIINNDRIEGYKTASTETFAEDLRSLFFKLERTSQNFKMELEAEVNRLGGTPEEGTKTSGKFYRIWMDLKAAITGSDRKAILDSCEYGEKVAMNAYQNVLKDAEKAITFEQRAMLSNHLNLLKADYQKVVLMQTLVESHD